MNYERKRVLEDLQCYELELLGLLQKASEHVKPAIKAELEELRADMRRMHASHQYTPSLVRRRFSDEPDSPE